MNIKPKIRNNIALNANPEGCKAMILKQINDLESLPEIGDKPLNVLIIGGSSGYGLASRIALTYKANAYTYNVSYEHEPSGSRSGSAGYYNNLYFQEITKLDGYDCDDYQGDAFSDVAKETVINHFKSLNKKIDLVIYSVASGVRIDPVSGEKYVSALKPVGESYSGNQVDIMTRKMSPLILESATSNEITNTIKVMGGEDYRRWADALINANILNEGVQFVTYTYIGSSITDPIYRNGTIGYAKSDLEKQNQEINELLVPLKGRALISASKAVVTKASVFIPTMALYVSALFKVMKEHGTHESIVEHKYRLFKSMVYNPDFVVDDSLILRLDQYELDPSIQNEVKELLNTTNQDNFIGHVGFESFIEDFLNINGFELKDL